MAETPARRRGAPRVLAAAFAAALTACSDNGAEATLSNYLSRLVRPLGVEAAEPTALNALRPPRETSLRIGLEDGVLGGLDFLKLKGCALQTTVARRNSSLGRVAPPSQRLLLDLAFLREAPACIELLREQDRAELAETLDAAATQKRRQLKAAIFNATLGGLEYRDFWRASAPSSAYPANTSSTVITSLEEVNRYVERWLEGNYEARDLDFELALGDIALGDGGELLRALQQQAAWLRAADRAIEIRLREGELCRAGFTPGSAPILRTVVGKYFIGEVQIRAADLEQRYHQLLTPIRELEALLDDALHDSYRSWMQQRDQQLQRSRAAPATHVGRLQELLGPCYAEFRNSGSSDV
jgi:hypothetical protein